MMKYLPTRFSALAKKELLYSPFGVSAWLTGLVFVDRLNKEKSRYTMEKTAALLREQNVSSHCSRLHDQKKKKKILLVITFHPTAVGLLFSPMVSGWSFRRVGGGKSFSRLYLRNCKV